MVLDKEEVAMTFLPSPDTEEMTSFLKHIVRQVPILDAEDKFMFFGNRKVGLQSVARHLLKDRAILKKDDRHWWAEKLRTIDVGSIFKFTIVRNPWDKALSAFYALQQLGKRPRISKAVTFRDFVKTVLRVQGIPYDIHFEFQYPRAYYNGEVFIDFIARLENITEDWKKIATVIDCDLVLPQENRSQHKHYSHYYDEECKKIVASLYREDIRLLEYEFQNDS